MLEALAVERLNPEINNTMSRSMRQDCFDSARILQVPYFCEVVCNHGRATLPYAYSYAHLRFAQSSEDVSQTSCHVRHGPEEVSQKNEKLSNLDFGRETQTFVRSRFVKNFCDSIK